MPRVFKQSLPSSVTSCLVWFWNCCCGLFSTCFSSTDDSSEQRNRIVTFPRGGHVVRICDTIGEGAFSFVYTAQQTNSSRDGPSHFALKKMYLQSSEFERCALAEVNSFQRFRHSNIMQLVDHVSLLEGGGDQQAKVKVMYMLFPLMERGNLRDLLNTQLAGGGVGEKEARLPPLPPLQEVLADVASICEALDVLHTFRPAYVHQDLKPENILIGHDGRPYLTDFGSVRLADVPIRDRKKALKVVEDAAQFCTISYRAPELFDPPTGLLLDTRTDVWAVGCLLFAWFYGYSPYECQFADEDSAGSSSSAEQGRDRGGRAKLRVVECSHSRVLTPPPTRAEAVTTPEDRIIAALAQSILKQNIAERPFLTDVIVQLHDLMGVLQHGSADVVDCGV